MNDVRWAATVTREAYGPTMKLYRGLKEPYRPEKVGAGQGRMFGTDFTDCPFTALR